MTLLWLTEEVFRVTVLITIVSLLPLCCISLLGNFIQAIFQIQDASSLHLLKLLILLISLMLFQEFFAVTFVDFYKNFILQASFFLQE